MPMNASGVSHIAICVQDLDVSLQFYCDVLGMSIVSDVIQDTTTGACPMCTPTVGPHTATFASPTPTGPSQL